MAMKRFGIVALALLAASGAAQAASAVNRDAEVRVLVVTEGSSRTELSVDAGQTVEFCASGCFVTMPNGDREALKGSETIEIQDGKGTVR